MKKIGLTMIVKDEADVIGRCLDSIFSIGLVDYFCIVDTGSTDDTVNIVQAMADQYNVEGKILKKPFTNFAECRDYALDGIRSHADIGFWIDAKEEIKVEEGKTLDKSIFDTDDYGAFLVMVQEGTMVYFRNNLFVIDEQVCWHGLVHEYLKYKGQSIRVDGLHIRRHYDGNSWKQPAEKFKKYVSLLEEQIELEPDEPRWLFYLAETYRGEGSGESHETAINYYSRFFKKEEKANPEEIYVARVMAATLIYKLYRIRNYNMLQKCSHAQRIEHLVTMAKLHLEEGHMRTAHLLLRTAYDKSANNPPASSIFVDVALYKFGIALSYSQFAFMHKDYAASRKALQMCEHNISFATPAEKHLVYEGLKELQGK
jgi:glycosyltransferase involved in cell wall biosynthesis